MSGWYVDTPTSRVHNFGSRTRQQALVAVEDFHRAELDTALGGLVAIQQGRSAVPFGLDEATARWQATESVLSLLHIQFGRFTVTADDQQGGPGGH